MCDAQSAQSATLTGAHRRGRHTRGSRACVRSRVRAFALARDDARRDDDATLTVLNHNIEF